MRKVFPVKVVRVMRPIGGFARAKVSFPDIGHLEWHYLVWVGAVCPALGFPINDMPDNALDSVRVSRNGLNWTGD